MKKSEVFFSKYVIDGAAAESTPAEMLSECMTADVYNKIFGDTETRKQGDTETRKPEDRAPQAHSQLDEDQCTSSPRHPVTLSPIIDELPDRTPVPFKYDVDKINDYIKSIALILNELRGNFSPVNPVHPLSSSRIQIAEAIIDAAWKTNVFELGDIDLKVSWNWDCEPIGNMALFHANVRAITEYISELGLHIMDVEFLQGNEETGTKIEILPSHTLGPDRVPATIQDLPNTVLLYIPFDTCNHKLGGSLLGRVLGKGDEAGNEIMDPDYFIDCFEVVHELVEDGIVLSAQTVGRGGLGAAADKILGEEHRVDLNIKGIERTYMESDPIRILFSEIPGALIQINESDRDYVDSQFLLQDIAYYPVGQAVRRNVDPEKIRLIKEDKAELSAILSALLSGTSAEGED